MCIFLYYINPAATEEDFYLILVNIRDEMYDRPSCHGDFWGNNGDIIGGLDAEAGKQGGTWFALSKTGKVGALLNVLQPDDEIAPNKKGRGFLVTDYVTRNEDCYRYLNKISSEKDEYNGFTLVTMDISSKKSPKVAYFSNISTPTPVIIDSRYSGFYAFGNSTSVESPWPKVHHAKDKFEKIVNRNRKVDSKSILISGLSNLVIDRKNYGVNENMEEQGRGKAPDFLHKLACIYVRMPEYKYGTRTQTIVAIEGSGKVSYVENNRIARTGNWRFYEYEFDLKCWN